MNNAFEFVDAGPIRDVAFGSKAGTYHQILAFGSPAIRCLDVPTSFFSIKLSTGDNTLKSCLALDVKNSITGIKIISQVMVVRVVVWPIVSTICQLTLLKHEVGAQTL
jgi:hypothetical protein